MLLKNILAKLAGKAATATNSSTTTTNNAPRVDVPTVAELAAEVIPAAILSPAKVDCKLDTQFAERAEKARGKSAAELTKRSAEATERAQSWQHDADEATASGNSKRAERAADVARRWQQLAVTLAKMADEAAAKEAADKAAAEAAARQEAARLATMTPDEVAASPADAQAIADAKRKAAKEARKVAQTAKANADKAEAEATAADVTAAKARDAHGEATDADAVTIAAADIRAGEAALVAAILAKVKETMTAVRALFGDILADEYSLSQVIKRLKSADRWPKVAKFFDTVGIPTTRAEFTPAVFDRDHAHPFLLVATGNGYKVGTMTAKGTQVVKRWSVESVLKYMVTSQILQTSADVTPAQVEARRAALARHEAALKVVREAAEAAEAAKATTEQARAELAAAADPTAPAITAAELAAKEAAVQTAEEAERAAKANTAAAKEAANEIGTDVQHEAAAKEAQQEAGRTIRTAAKYGTIPAEIARKAMRAAKEAQRRAADKARKAGDEAEAARVATPTYLGALFVQRAARAQGISEADVLAQMAA